MRLILALSLTAAALFAAWLFIDFAAIGAWAVAQQRLFQNEMAAALVALRGGDANAYLVLMTAAGAYGFVHALGPGHGKFLIGGVGLGTSVSIGRLLAVSVISSLGQALWAIVLVFGGFYLLEASVRGMTGFAEDILAPMSYAAIGVIGVVLAVRGLWALATRPRDVAAAPRECGCASHSVPVDKLAAITTAREFAALVLSIAVRPCTGAVFLLAIGWQMDIRIASAAAVVAMGLGTAILTSLVATSSIVARSIAFASATTMGSAHLAFSVMQVLAGGAVVMMSVALLGFSLR